MAALACAAAGAFVSLALGQDANWDLRNYHLYNPWAFFHGRLDVDHHPGSRQSYLNPVLDVLTYPLLTAVPDHVGGAVLGAIHGMALLGLFALARGLTGPGAAGMLLAAIAAVVGSAASVAIGEVGTTFGDLTTATLVLAALVIVAPLYVRVAGGAGTRLAVAGLLLGVATGLKLTNGLYLSAFVLAVAFDPPAPRPRALALVILPAMAAVLALQGWWAAMLTVKYGSPLFPFLDAAFLLNQIGPSVASTRPGTPIELLFFPFFFGLDHRTGEVPFRDFRMAAGLVAVVGLALLRWRRPGAFAVSPVAQATRFLMTFVVAAYLVWMVCFSVQRYALVLDMLSPLLCILLLGHARVVTSRLALAVALGATLIATTVVADWGRVPWDGGPYSVVWNFEGPPPGSAILVGARPLAVIAPTVDLPDAVWIGGPFNREDDSDQRERKIGDRPRHLMTLAGSHWAETARRTMRLMDVHLTAPCSAFSSKLAGTLLLCSLARGAEPVDLGDLHNDAAQWSIELRPVVASLHVAPGAYAWLTLEVRNTGTQPILANLPDTARLVGRDVPPEPFGDVNLSYHLATPNGAQVVHDGLRTRLPRSIPPGGHDVVSMRVLAPPQPGHYHLDLDVVDEGVAWADARSAAVDLLVE